MKKALIAFGVLFVLVVAAIAVLPSLVPADRIRQEVVAQVKSATGRDLTIDGKVAVSAFPSLSVQVSNIALSNPPGFQGKDMVRLGALDVRLKVLPILSGKVEVDSFVLVDPVISLEVDRQGRANWVFGDAQPQPQQAKSGGAGGGPSDLSLGQVRIENGKLSFVDAKAGTREQVDAINLAVDLKNLDSPLKAKGGLKWRGKTIDLAADLARPRALLDGTASPGELSIGSDAVKLTFKGEAAAASVKGDLGITIPSVRGLVQWTTGKPLDLPGSGLGPFSLTGKLAAGGTKVALGQAIIALDAIKASGDVAVDSGGARPSLRGKLEVDALDLNPYLPPDQPAKPAAQAKSDWSDDAIDASGLKAADVDLGLTANSITLRKIKIGKSALHLKLEAGKLDADLARLELYDGSGKGRLMLDGSQPGVGLDATFTLAGLKAGPFLADAANFDRLEGTGSADIHVTARGRSERALVSGLDGKGGMTFLNGAIKGINLAEMVRNVGSAFTAQSGAQKTDFAELGGTFVIDRGTLTNKDLALKSPLLRVEGAGTVELPPRTVHYRIEPKAVASLEGQGGKGDLGGVTVPVIVEGKWDNLSFRPDLAAMAKGQAGKAIEGALGGRMPVSGSSGEKGPLPINPGSLFGR